MPSLQLKGHSSDHSGGAMGGVMDKDAQAKAEVRRARRCELKYQICIDIAAHLGCNVTLQTPSVCESGRFSILHSACHAEFSPGIAVMY